MNKYGSNLRVFTAANIAESTISPPTDLSIAAQNVAVYDPADQWKPTQPFFDFIARDGAGITEAIAQNSNIFINRVGVFGNFADGLVFSSAANPLRVQIAVDAYRGVTVHANTLALVDGSKTATGAYGTIVAGTYLWIGNHIVRVASVDGLDTSLELTDYWHDAADDYPVYVLSLPSSLSIVNLGGIRTLNDMVYVERLIRPGNLVGLTAYELVTARVSVLNENASVFLTKSIDPDFDGDEVFFDVKMEVEYTPASS